MFKKMFKPNRQKETVMTLALTPVKKAMKTKPAPKVDKYDLNQYGMELKLGARAETLEYQLNLHNHVGLAPLIGEKFQHHVDAITKLQMTQVLTAAQATSARNRLRKQIARDIVHGLNL